MSSINIGFTSFFSGIRLDLADIYSLPSIEVGSGKALGLDLAL